MNYQASKIENCFADSQTYEYLLPVTGEQMISRLSDWDLRINRKLRRPTAIAQKEDVIIKFILSGNRYRVSFPDKAWQEEKEKFEKFLETLSWIE